MASHSASMWPSKFSRIPFDFWAGVIDGVPEQFTVVGICGDNPVVLFRGGARDGCQAVLDGVTGEVLSG